MSQSLENLLKIFAKCLKFSTPFHWYLKPGTSHLGDKMCILPSLYFENWGSTVLFLFCLFMFQKDESQQRWAWGAENWENYWDNQNKTLEQNLISQFRSFPLPFCEFCCQWKVKLDNCEQKLVNSQVSVYVCEFRHKWYRFLKMINGSKIFHFNIYGIVNIHKKYFCFSSCLVH